MTRLDAIRKRAEAVLKFIGKERRDLRDHVLADIPYLLELVRELREALSGKTEDEPTCEHQQEWTWWLESKCRFYCSQCFRRALARCDELEEG